MEYCALAFYVLVLAMFIGFRKIWFPMFSLYFGTGCDGVHIVRTSVPVVKKVYGWEKDLSLHVNIFIGTSGKAEKEMDVESFREFSDAVRDIVAEATTHVLMQEPALSIATLFKKVKLEMTAPVFQEKIRSLVCRVTGKEFTGMKIALDK